MGKIQLPGCNIPVRTFADWNAPPPGFLEIDLLAHCGDNMGSPFVYSLVATDVCPFPSSG